MADLMEGLPFDQMNERDILVSVATTLSHLGGDVRDHEGRLRVVETKQTQHDEAAKSYITPKHLWVGAGGLLVACTGLIAAVHTIWRW